MAQGQGIMIRRLLSRFRRRPLTLEQRNAKRERQRQEYLRRYRDPLP
jgi:hypothetical protein